MKAHFQQPFSHRACGIARQALFLAVILAILIQPIAPGGRSLAKGDVPEEIEQYIQYGEDAFELIPVNYGGRTYRVFYFTAQMDHRPRQRGEIFFEADESRWDAWGVQAVLVTDNFLQPVVDENLLRQVMLVEMSGYLEFFHYRAPAYVPADSEFLDEMSELNNSLASNIAFLDKKAVSLLTDNPQELYTEALRLMLATPSDEAPLVQDFASFVTSLIENGDSVKGAVQAAAEVERFANDKTIRTVAQKALRAFDKFDKEITPSDFRYKIAGQEVSFANYLDLVTLGINLLFIDQLSAERAELLAALAADARAGEVQLPGDLLAAMDTVVAEAENVNMQRLSILEDFVIDHAGEMLVSVGMDKLKEMTVKWIWQKFGTRVTGHLVGGAFASVFLGFAIADVLYGRDAIYENSVMAEYSAKISKTMLDNLDSLKEAHQYSPVDYRDEETLLYRNTAIWYNLAAAQWYSSYAAVIRSGRLLTGIANLLTGGEWDRAQQEFTRLAEQGNTDTHRYLIRPEFIEYAIVTDLARAAIGLAALTNTVFVIDVSGSMDNPDPTGGTKMDAARRAMQTLLRMIRAENRALGPVNQFAVITFSTDAAVLSPMGVDTTPAEQAVKGMWPQSGTNMLAGLENANDILAELDDAQKIIILLSDGVPTVSPSFPGSASTPAVLDEILAMEQEILDGPVEDARDDGHCIYAIGFGDPTRTDQLSDGSEVRQLDVAFLKDVAEGSGCGDYLNARDATQLVKVYIKLRHTSIGRLLAEDEGVIEPGETSPAQEFNVGWNQGALVASLNYPGSVVDLILRDPDGVEVTLDYPGATITEERGMALITVMNPRWGQWSLAVYGRDVPEEGEPYYVAVSTRRLDLSLLGLLGPWGLAGAGVLALCCLITPAAGLLIWGVRRKPRASARPPRPARAPAAPQSPYAGTPQLIGVGGSLAGYTLPLQDGLVFGRGNKCQVQLSEKVASREHAMLRYYQGWWYIQDMNSKTGLFVNGQRVSSVALRPGDRIRMGLTEIEFRVL